MTKLHRTLHTPIDVNKHEEIASLLSRFKVVFITRDPETLRIPQEAPRLRKSAFDPRCAIPADPLYGSSPRIPHLACTALRVSRATERSSSRSRQEKEHACAGRGRSTQRRKKRSHTAPAAFRFLQVRKAGRVRRHRIPARALGLSPTARDRTRSAEGYAGKGGGE